jgi:hypothetical protein
MSDDDKSEYEAAVRNPYRDDPVWEDWHAQAYGVQGGVDDTSSSESEDESGDSQPVILPSTCLCQQCRLVILIGLSVPRWLCNYEYAEKYFILTM